ncbi:hypothetical protein [Tautonia sociabilis]|uniref:Uncharacterized protein n=1 Tax=Tautonia sociabilis TaxID=2080755 RepID=A0A432ME90_9BACT|nr:hypothetical protein [Tautonia sociabilis]RUL83569.1 hypothetical protein TsocGM_21940 [Tautonia sociabilis]
MRASSARAGAARDGREPDRATDPAAGNSAAGQQEQSGTLCAVQHTFAAGAGLSLHAEATSATDTIPTIARRANQRGREW